MGKDSKIQWCSATWNPWHGCKKVSTGCKYCYMYRDKERYGQDPTTVLKSKTMFKQPLKWKEGKLIFTCSWSDWFIEEADDWRDEAWAIIKATPQHTYQILTKRPERILEHLPADWGDGYPNVWLGISAEDMVSYQQRMEYFKEVKAHVKFISAEPLLNALINIHHDQQFIDWVIIGGESGSLSPNAKYKARVCDIAWIERIIRQCGEADIPVFVKQLGTYLANMYRLQDRHGGDITQWKDELAPLAVREFPKSWKNR